MSRKIIYFLSEDWFFCSHFFERAVAARNAGYDVVVIARELKHGGKIRGAGFKFIPIALDRRSFGFFSEIGAILSLYQIYKSEKPEVVHHVAAKPIFYGTIAATLSGVKGVVNAPVGLGYVFSSADIRARILRPFIWGAYWLLLNRRLSKVIFENFHDLSLFVRSGIVKKSDAVLIRGAGINLEAFCPQPEASGAPVVMLIARMLRDKGVMEYLAAARELHNSGVVARFVLVGAPDPGNPATISIETLQSWNGKYSVEWWGWQDDISNIMQKAHVVCLPSYREGLPKSLLEAAACGLPIVTTNAVGCRDIVQHGENGYLVPVKDTKLLADALRKLIEAPELRRSMGRKGRALAEAEFSSERIIAETLAVYSTMGPQKV